MSGDPEGGEKAKSQNGTFNDVKPEAPAQVESTSKKDEAVVSGTEETVPAGLLPVEDESKTVIDQIIEAIPSAVIAATNLDGGADFRKMAADNFSEGTVEGVVKGVINTGSGLMEKSYNTALAPAINVVEGIKDLYANLGALITTDDTANAFANLAIKVVESTLPPGGPAVTSVEIPKTITTEKIENTLNIIDLIKTFLNK